MLHQQRGDPEAAIAPLSRAAALAPDSARIPYHLGNALLATDRAAEAEAAFRRALALDPALLEARNNLGNALRRQHRLPGALDTYRAVLARQPDFAPALYNMGLALAECGEFPAAIDCYRSVLARPPRPDEIARYADVQEALSGALVEMGRHADAVAACRVWQRLDPGNWRAEWNESLSLLALGRYAEGWVKYEQRWNLPEARAHLAGADPPAVPARASLFGKHVLLRAEQGLGDVIQFARYAPLLAPLVGSLSLQVYPELRTLLGRMPGIATAVGMDDPPPAHDAVLSVLSLPLLFATTLQTIPARVPYLAPRATAVAAWRARLGGPARHVGLCWWGSEHSRRSAIPLPALAPLLRLPGLRFHSLQPAIAPEHRAWLAANPLLAEHGAQLVDFDATAALVAALDLVITIDTSVAHLAGALGRPSWILLRHSADWRWLRDRDDSPWYPTARLFRQGPDRSWDAVIATVRDALGRWRDGGRAGTDTNSERD